MKLAHICQTLHRRAGPNLRTEPWPFLRVGQRVAIESGSLAGLEGILQQVRKTCRLVVSVNLLQRSVAVEVDRDWVRPLGVHPALAWTAGAGACAPQ